MVEFDFTKAIFETGKILFDNLFKKKLTKKDIEEIISKHNFGNNNIKERIIIVINENQELIYSENGTFQIRSLNLDRLEMQELFINMLLNNVKDPNKKDKIIDVEWEDVPRIENISDEETKLINKIKQKHKELYGE